MKDPAYNDVLEALNSLISEKPKVGDRQAYEAAYQSMQTYLEVLNLMLLVSLAISSNAALSMCHKPKLHGLVYRQRLDLVSELTKLKVIHVAGTKGKVRRSAIASCVPPDSTVPFNC